MKSNLNEGFARRLRELLESRSMSYRQAADVVESVNYSSFSSYTSGRRVPNVETLKDIAVSFGVSADWLLGITDSKLNKYSKDAQELIDLYYLANDDEKEIIQILLRKYKDAGSKKED